MGVREFLDTSVQFLAAALFLNFLSSIYLMYVKIEKLASYFPNCKAVQSRRYLCVAGYWGRIALYGAICGIATFPKLHVRHGNADQRDIDSVPQYVRLGLTIKTLMSCALLVCMFSLVEAHKFIEKDPVQEFDRWDEIYVYAWIFLTTAYWAYLAYFKRDEIIGYLPRCEVVQVRLVSFNNAFHDRMLFVFLITLLLAHPKSCVQRGGADQQDIDDFPRALKNRLLVAYALSAVALINIIVGILVVKN